MLLSILNIQNMVGTTDFYLLSLLKLIYKIKIYYDLGFFIAFCVKTPLWPLSIWLPKAHSDSVLAGSIILAGTILKLATYGFIRILISFLPDSSFYFLLWYKLYQ